MNLHLRYKEREAIPLLEKAVAIDPKFAVAQARLATIYGNIGSPLDAGKYAKLALDNSAHLSPRERLYIEAVYYTQRPETFDRAIDAYRKLLDLYPGDAAARNNLTSLLALFERDEEIIRHGEEMRRRGDTFPPSYQILANAYAQSADFDKGLAVLREYLQRFPDNAAGYVNLAGMLVASRKFDDAIGSYEKAKGLGARDAQILPGQVSIAVQRDDFALADTLARQLLASSTEPLPTANVWAMRIAIAGYRGRVQEAANLAAEAARTLPPPFNSAGSQFGAAIEIERGQAAKAQALGEEALARMGNAPPRLVAAAALAVAQARGGQAAKADQTLLEVQTIAAARSNPAAKRSADIAVGQVALARGNVPQAVEILTKTAAALPRRVTGVGWGIPQHVQVWYALGQAHLAAGNQNAAAEVFRKIAESGSERVAFPMQFVRSFYFLGQLAEKQGDQARAREYYGRFLNYWKDGDIDRERIAEIRKKLG
jgi:tetratricopeptide (TPR) repeat protein